MAEYGLDVLTTEHLSSVSIGDGYLERSALCVAGGKGFNVYSILNTDGTYTLYVNGYNETWAEKMEGRWSAFYGDSQFDELDEDSLSELKAIATHPVVEVNFGATPPSNASKVVSNASEKQVYLFLV